MVFLRSQINQIATDHYVNPIPPRFRWEVNVQGSQFLNSSLHLTNSLKKTITEIMYFMKALDAASALMTPIYKNCTKIDNEQQPGLLFVANLLTSVKGMVYSCSNPSNSFFMFSPVTLMYGLECD